MFYESLIILNISTLNFSEGVPASVICIPLVLATTATIMFSCTYVDKSPTKMGYSLVNERQFAR